MSATRREFLRMAGAATASAAASAAVGGFEAVAQTARPAWDAGNVAHILPTVSHDRLLLKISFRNPHAQVPVLRVGGESVRGERTDSAGQYWQFDASGLAPNRTYTLALVSAGDNRALCETWPIKTFPAPEDRPERLRLLIYTCAGGHDEVANRAGRTAHIKAAIRNRLIRRALEFAPDAVVGIGDHVYWDLFSPRVAPFMGQSPLAKRLGAQFDRAQPVMGTQNERSLLTVVRPQFVDVYGVDLRSIPIYFVRDDHDYFDNDDADDQIVTFPPDHFMLEMARATQRLFYPEFLPDAGRPLGLPGSSFADRPRGTAESFGTLRYGRLAEVLLYDIRRSMTMAGPSAVYLDRTVEDWLKARMAATEVTHVVNVPSNPPGWSAGKWGEWYPDVLDDNGVLTDAVLKPYWQRGWLAQHDRLLAAMHAMKSRIPLVISGDLHAIAEGRITRSGKLDFASHPIVAALSGPISTGDLAWPSAARGVGPKVPKHLDMAEVQAPLEENGFTLMDFTSDSITLRYFRWNYRKEPVDVIETLQPFRTSTIQRPA